MGLRPTHIGEIIYPIWLIALNIHWPRDRVACVAPGRY